MNKPEAVERAGARLRPLRVAKGIKASWIALRLGISQSYLSDLERDRRGWSADLIRQYEESLGFDPLTANKNNLPKLTHAKT